MRVTLRRTSRFAALLIVGIAASWAFDLFVGPPVPGPAGLDRMDPIVAEAVRDALESARRQKGNESRRMTLGMVYEANGMLGLAMACYGEVAEARPHDARVQYRIAHVEERSGDLRAAIESAQRVVKLDPSYEPARAQLGLWLLDDGRMDEAAAHFREVVARDPGNEAALFGMVLHALRAREPERASKLLLEHDLLNGSNPGYARHLDLSIRRQLREQVSVAEGGPGSGQGRPQWRDPWNDAARAHQTGVRLLRRTARSHMSRGQYAHAANLLERARRAEPGNTRILIALATCYRNQGRTGESSPFSTKRSGSLRMTTGRISTAPTCCSPGVRRRGCPAFRLRACPGCNAGPAGIRGCVGARRTSLSGHAPVRRGNRCVPARV